jgi:radical SAM protein with 4Fe4S-binding SPASM domain
MKLPYVFKIFYKRECMPEYFIYFVTNRCNCKCKFCFFWKELNKQKDELKLHEIKKIIKSMDPVLFLVLTGGEPFLREDLPEIVQEFYKNKKAKIILIPTNGLATEKIVNSTKRILETCKGINLIINMSIDDIGDKHDNVRNVKGLFKKLKKTHDELFLLKKRFSNLDLGSVIVFSSLNQDRIFEIYNYIKSKFKFDSISSALVRGDVKLQSLKAVDVNIYDKFTKVLEKDLISRRVKGHNKFFLSEFSIASNIILRKQLIKAVKENKFISPCYAGNLIGVMYSDGDVYACEMLDKKIGNVREYDYDFKKLWLSENAIRIRKWVKDTKCFCTHECNWATNILFNPRYLPKLIYLVTKLKINSINKK